MSVLIRAILEFFRVFFLFAIYSGLIFTLVRGLEMIFAISLPQWVKAILGIFFLSVFLVWYRTKGQYKGWYPAEKNK